MGGFMGNWGKSRLWVLLATLLLLTACGGDDDLELESSETGGDPADGPNLVADLAGYWVIPRELVVTASSTIDRAVDRGMPLVDIGIQTDEGLRILPDGFFHYRYFDFNYLDVEPGELVAVEAECFGRLKRDATGIGDYAECFHDEQYRAEIGFLWDTGGGFRDPRYLEIESISDTELAVEFGVSAKSCTEGTLSCDDVTSPPYTSPFGGRFQNVSIVDEAAAPFAYRPDEPDVDLNALAGLWEGDSYSLEVDPQPGPAEAAAVRGSYRTTCAVSGELTPLNSYGRIARIRLDITGCGFASELEGVVEYYVDDAGENESLHLAHDYVWFSDALYGNGRNREAELTRPE
jgi:hypothetical protein